MRFGEQTMFNYFALNPRAVYDMTRICGVQVCLSTCFDDINSSRAQILVIAIIIFLFLQTYTMKLLLLVFGMVLVVEGLPYAAAPEKNATMASST